MPHVIFSALTTKKLVAVAAECGSLILDESMQRSQAMSELLSIFTPYSATSTSYCFRISLGKADRPSFGSSKAFLQVGQFFISSLRHLKQNECKQGSSRGSVKNLEHSLQVAREEMDAGLLREEQNFFCLDDANFSFIAIFNFWNTCELATK